MEVAPLAQVIAPTVGRVSDEDHLIQSPATRAVPERKRICEGNQQVPEMHFNARNEDRMVQDNRGCNPFRRGDSKDSGGVCSFGDQVSKLTTTLIIERQDSPSSPSWA